MMVLKVARPTLIVNAEDDMVCLAENIREDIVAALPGAVLLRFGCFVPTGPQLSSAFFWLSPPKLTVNAEENSPPQSSMMLIVSVERTQRGSHIAFNEGIFGTGNYLSR